MKHLIFVALLLISQIASSQSLVKDINVGYFDSYISELVEFDDKLFFNANDGNGLALWFTDGSTTQQVTNSLPNDNPVELTVIGDNLVFSIDRNGGELAYISIGSTTQEIIASSSGSAYGFLKIGNTMYCASDRDGSGVTIWYASSLPLNNSTVLTKAAGDSPVSIYSPFMSSEDYLQTPHRALVASEDDSKIIFGPFGSPITYVLDVASKNITEYQFAVENSFGGTNTFYTMQGDYCFYGARETLFDYGLGYFNVLNPSGDFGYIDRVSIPSHFTNWDNTLFFHDFDESSNLHGPHYIDVQQGELFDESQIKVVTNNQNNWGSNSAYFQWPYYYMDGNLFYASMQIEGTSNGYNMSSSETCLGVRLSPSEVIFQYCCFQFYDCDDASNPLTCFIEYDNLLADITIFNGSVYCVTSQPDLGKELWVYPGVGSSDLCNSNDCSTDNTPPTCNIGPFTVQLDSGQDYYTFDINDFASDDCSTILTYENASLDPSTPNGTSTHFWSGNDDQFGCGTYIVTSSFPFDDAGNFSDCGFEFTVECSNDDISGCNVDFNANYNLIIGNEERNIFVKSELIGTDLFVLTYDGETNEESSRLAKYNEDGNVVWETSFEDSLIINSFLIDGNRILLPGFTRPFENGNLSALIQIEDLGNDYLIRSANKFDISIQREASRGLIKLSDTDTPYAMLIHKGWISIDDTQIALLNGDGEIVDIRNYNLSDDQVWAGPINDLDNSIAIFGEEANDTNEGFVISAKYDLDTYEAFSFFGIGYVRDIAVDFDRRQRLLTSNKALTLVDENYSVLHSVRTSNTQLNRQLEGPFLQNGGSIYFLLSQVEYLGDVKVNIAKIEVDQSNQINVLWSKVLDTEGVTMNTNFSVEFNNDEFEFLVGQSVVSSENSLGNSDIGLSRFGEESCDLIDFPLTIDAITINLVPQVMTVSNQSIPALLPLNVIEGDDYECQTIESCDPCLNDTTPPIVSCPFNIGTLSLDANGEFVPTMSDFDISVTDDCKVAMEFSPASFNCEDLGLDNSVNVVVSDEAGNSSNCNIGFDLVDPLNSCLQDTCENVVISFGSQNEYITLQDVNATSDFTLGGWVLPSSSSNGGVQDRIFSFGPSNRLEIGLVDNGGLWIFDQSANLNETYDNIRDGNWHHIAFVAEGSERRLYLDFALVHSYIVSTIQYGDNFRLGNWLGGPTVNEAYSGLLDEFRLYDTAYGEEDLCNVFSTFNLDDNSNLYIYFDFEEGFPGGNNTSITSVVDQVGVNNGLLSNFDLIADISNYVCSELTFEGCIDSCATDEIDPICNVQPITLSLDMNGVADLSPEMLDSDSYDECSSVTLEVDVENFSCDNIGENLVTLMVFDESNNVSSCTTTVTIEDKTAPICMSQDFSITLNQNGLRNINVAQINNGTTDNCGEFTLELSKTTFTCEDIGENEVTLTAVDASGNVSTCSSIVTVADVIKPKCVASNITINLNQNGQKTINANVIDNGSSDNCGSVSREISQTLFTCEDIGENDVVLTVTDASGNISECNAIVTVQDTIPPSLICESQLTMFSLDSSGEVMLSLEDLEVALEDECDDSVNVEFSQNTFTCSDLGTNIISIIATDNSGNTASCHVDVEIVDANLNCNCLIDNTSPVINCSSHVVIYELGPNGTVDVDLSQHGIEVFDECGVDQIIPNLDIFDCTLVGSVPQFMPVTAVDIAGNMSQCEISFIVIDPNNYCIPEECNPACYTGTLDLSTGINNLGEELPIGEYVGNWQLVDGPDDDVNYPRPGFVLNPNNVWAQLPGSQYISPFPNATNNGSFSEPYLFERCFCVCEEDAQVDVNISAHVDNFIDIGLYDDNGTLIEELITYNGSASTSTFLDPAFMSNTSHNLSSGTYCLRAGMRNDGSVTMGMQINASITSAGFESSQCCTPYAFILGTVFEDSNCDSLINLTADGGIQGVTVNLLSNNNIVDTAITDVYGYYVFSDVAVGEYDVEVEVNSGFLPSLGEGGYQIEMLADTVIGNLDFGLCNPCLFDNEPPLINCSESLVTYELGNNGKVNLDPTLHDISYEDNCEILSVEYSQTTFTCVDLIGIPYSVQVIVTDESGNSTICEIEVLIDDPNYHCIPEECDQVCYSDVIDLSTGINNLGIELPIGAYVGNWQLIDGPDENVNYPRPGYVLNPHHAWDQLIGSQYISPFPNALNNQSFDIPYLFERCFCVCEDDATINLDLSVHVDNFINVGLYDDSGVLIEDLISYNGPSDSSTFRDPAFTSNTTHELSSGTYCLRAGLRNDNSTAMGMSINAAVSNAGFISSECCSPYGFIIGSVFEDTQCDSIFNLTADPGLEGIQVDLYGNDGIIATSTTDQYGYYIFSDIESGSYSISCEGQDGAYPTLGEDFIDVVLMSDTVVSGIDFGYCSITEPCCASPIELTHQVQIGLNSELINLSEGCNLILSLNSPELFDCQYVSKIYWGDGLVESFESIQDLPSHNYNGGGSYSITLEVTSSLSSGEVCQVDEVQHIVSIKDCISSTDFVNPDIGTLKIYPIPFNDYVQIDFSLNETGYQLELFNINGQLIDQVYIDSGVLNYSYDSSNLPSGSYLFKFVSTDTQYSFQVKVIKI